MSAIIIPGLDRLPNGAVVHYEYPTDELSRKDFERVADELTASGLSVDVDGARYVPTSIYVWRGPKLERIEPGRRPYSDLLQAVNKPRP